MRTTLTNDKRHRFVNFIPKFGPFFVYFTWRDHNICQISEYPTTRYLHKFGGSHVLQIFHYKVILLGIHEKRKFEIGTWGNPNTMSFVQVKSFKVIHPDNSFVEGSYIVSDFREMGENGCFPKCLILHQTHQESFVTWIVTVPNPQKSFHWSYISKTQNYGNCFLLKNLKLLSQKLQLLSDLWRLSLRSNPLRNRFIALLYTSNRF